MLSESSPNPTRKPAPADKIWQAKLREIQTVFGKLVFLGALRDAAGVYRDEALYGLLGAAEAERTIRHSHYQVFSRWLSFSLSEQKEDLGEFLGGLGNSRDGWAPDQYQRVIPPCAREAERQLYLTDLETVLTLMKSERNGASSHPAT